ncbi:MAG: hypothetical protein AVDCRST_MAG49-910, partial [uncultured Thermomicrobiales bacterium]
DAGGAGAQRRRRPTGAPGDEPGAVRPRPAPRGPGPGLGRATRRLSYRHRGSL